jgi:hypothetical protein
VRHRLGGAILAATAGLLAAVGSSDGQQAGAPPRPLDLESQALPMPPPTGWKVIATTPVPGAPSLAPPVVNTPGSAPPVANAPGSPRRTAGSIQPATYETTDPVPPHSTPPPARPTVRQPNALVPDEEGPPAKAAPANPVKPPPAPTGAPVVSPSAPAGTALALEVVGPSQAAPGQAMPVEIIARNTGAGALTRVRVEASLPAGTRLLLSDPPAETQGDRLAWSLGTIHAGAERHLRLEVQPATGGEWTLEPIASFAPAVGLRTPIVQPPFALSVSGPESVAPGTKVVFRIQAVNHTENLLDKVIVRVQLPPGIFQAEAAKAHGRIDTFPISLNPGETRTLPLEALAQAPGRQVVEVMTSPESGHQAPPARTVVVVTEPPLAVGLNGPRTASLGHDFDLQLEVSNPTEFPAANARLAQSVPKGLEVVAASPGATPAADGQSIVWPLGTLAPKQRRAFTCTLRPRAGGEWPLYAVAAADNAGEARASHAVRVEGSPPLTLEVSGSEIPMTVGAETIYEVRVLNNSDLPATNVRLTAWMPPELVPLNPSQGPTEAQIQPTQVQFAPLARLDPHADAVYSVRARAHQAGHGRFRVEMNADQLAWPLLHDCGAVVQAGP